MSDLRLVAVQTRFQLRSTARNRRVVVFSILFPVVLLVMFNSIFTSGQDKVELAGAKVTAHAYFTGGMLAYAVMLSGFSGLAISLVSQRETGQLKRLRGTPVPAWTFIVATVLRVMVTVGVMTAVLLLISDLAYGVHLSGAAVLDVAVYVALGTATMCSLGIAATTLAADVDSASAALPLAAVILSLISGIFVPVDQLPGWLAEIGRIIPVAHIASGVQTALGIAGDTGLHGSDVATLAVWALGGIVLASRRFRWEPGRGTA